MFSVVIPLYNKQEFIERTVASVLSQTHADFELIVVDDGSTDHSVERLQHVSDPRMRILRQANAGEGAARNRGMAEASRAWIALLDADDYWFPDHLAELAAIIGRHPDAGMVATSYAEGEEPAAAQPAQGPSIIREIDYFMVASRDIGVVWSSVVALRRSIAAAVGGFASFRRGADLEYWARMALVAPVAKSSRITAYYFRHGESIMALADRERSVAAVPPSLAELWPSVEYLERVKHAPENASGLPGIERYERHAAYLSMKGQLLRGEVGHARHLARTLPGRRVDRAAIVGLLSYLPAPPLSLALRIWTWLRRTVR
jgi:glycosyltransferase involved in cell wall biosynthesis